MRFYLINKKRQWDAREGYSEEYELPEEKPHPLAQQTTVMASITRWWQTFNNGDRFPYRGGIVMLNAVISQEQVVEPVTVWHVDIDTLETFYDKYAGWAIHKNVSLLGNIKLLEPVDILC